MKQRATKADSDLKPVTYEQPSLFDDPAIRALLKPDEDIVWTGRPDPLLFSFARWVIFTFGLPLVLLQAYLFVFLLAFKQHRTELGDTLLFVLPFTGIALFCLLMILPSWIVRRGLRKAEYAITNRRVLLIRPLRSRMWNTAIMATGGIYAVEAEQLRRRCVKRFSPTRVDITFSQRLGLVGLRDWEEAEAILQSRFPREPPALVEPALTGRGSAFATGRWIYSGIASALYLYVFFAAWRAAAPAPVLIILGLFLVRGYFWLWERPRRTIVSFHCDGRHLTFSIRHGEQSLFVPDVNVIVHRSRPETGRSKLFGWWIQTQSYKWVYLDRDTANAPELAAILLAHPPRWTRAEQANFRLQENTKRYMRNWHAAKKNARRILGRIR